MIPISRLILAIVIAFAQSGAGGSRAGQREYGVNLTFAVYQFDVQRSPSVEEILRLASTFSSPEEEIAHIKDKYKLEEVAVRHMRSVGLRSGEAFNDAVLLGPEYMTFNLTPRDVVKGSMKLDLKVRYANASVLDAKNVEMENFETVLFRGGKGMFGAKYFIGAGGRQESAPAERTLLLSITPEIVPLASLRNRPENLSRPVDEFGSPLRLNEDDRFTPPVALERVAPKFEAGRPIRGSVLVSAQVTPEGRVINVKVLRGIDPIIDERAVDAFRRYRFSPALLNGKPIHATYREEITFEQPGPTLLEIQEEERKRREAERQKEKRRP